MLWLNNASELQATSHANLLTPYFVTFMQPVDHSPSHKQRLQPTPVPQPE